MVDDNTHFSSTRKSSTTHNSQVKTTAITKAIKGQDIKLQKIANRIRTPNDLDDIVTCAPTVHQSNRQTSINQKDSINISNKNTTNIELFLTDKEGGNSVAQHQQPSGVVITEDDDDFNPRGHGRYSNAFIRIN